MVLPLPLIAVTPVKASVINFLFVFDLKNSKKVDLPVPALPDSKIEFLVFSISLNVSFICFDK